MKSSIRSLLLTLFAAILFTSCSGDGNDFSYNPVNDSQPNDDVIIDIPITEESATDEATDESTVDKATAKPEHIKKIIEEALNSTFGDVGQIGIWDLIESLFNGTINIKEGLTVDIYTSYDPFKLKLTFTFDEFGLNCIDSTISGIMTARIEHNIQDKAILMVMNTDDDTPLTLAGGEFDGTTIELEDLMVLYEYVIMKYSFNGKIIIDGTEYTLDDLLECDPSDFVPLEKIMNVLAVAMNQIDWNLIQEQFLSLVSDPAQDFESLIIRDYDGLKIEMQIITDTEDPGIIFYLTFTEFQLEEYSNLAISGEMTMLMTLHSYSIFPCELIVKMLLNTEPGAPLVITGGLFDQTVGFDDVALYYDLCKFDFADEPDPSGTFIINGIPVPVDEDWLNLLLAILIQ
ncbi:MAG: hypothetical protein SVZ03_05605 [Spirochaetota bacterium]|nr:hypothetical protein [Spirochaetota bacterium]